MPCGAGPAGPAAGGFGRALVGSVGTTAGGSGTTLVGSGSGTVTVGSWGRFVLGRFGSGTSVFTAYGIGAGSAGRDSAMVVTTWLAIVADRPDCGTIRYV